MRDFLLHTVGSPFFWPFAFFVPLYLFSRFLMFVSPLARLMHRRRYFAAIAGLAVIAGFFVADFAQLRSHAFLDHVQPNVASQAWLFWRGEPLYHGLGTEERYSLHYGPLLFAITGASQALLGPSAFSTKLPAALAGALALVVTFFLLWRRSSWPIATAFTGLAAALLLNVFHLAFAARGDAYLILAVALAALAAMSPGRANALLVGLCFGVAANLKIHAVVYFLPICVLIYHHGWNRRQALIALVTGVVTAFLPFVVFRNVSLGNYLGALRMASHHGPGIPEYHTVVEWTATILGPLLVLIGISWYRRKEETRCFVWENRAYLRALSLAFMLIMYPASKVGAGKHHLLPLVPLALLPAAALAERRMVLPWARDASSAVASAFIGSWLIGCGGSAVWAVNFIIKTAGANDAAALARIEDLQRIVRANPEATVLMGAGSAEGYEKTYERSSLVFAGMPVGLDACTVMDFQRGRFPESDLPRLGEELRRRYQRPPLWLLPRGDEPFSMKNFYPPFGPLFSERFREDFSRWYERRETTEHFDLYRPR